jgi:hypothetical protein
LKIPCWIPCSMVNRIQSVLLLVNYQVERWIWSTNLVPWIWIPSFYCSMVIQLVTKTIQKEPTFSCWLRKQKTNHFPHSNSRRKTYVPYVPSGKLT